jgi:hypothetical protein
MNSDVFSTFVYWCREREAILRRKKAGEPRPWTDDEILNRYRFCNLHREDDRVTRWIARHTREPYADSPNLWFMLALARHINWPPTLQEIMDRGLWPARDYYASAIVNTLRDRHARAEKVFTSAYMLNNRSVPRGVDKAQCVAGSVLASLWEKRESINYYLSPQLKSKADPTIQGTHERLCKINGIGQFMAYQICVDMRWTRYLCDAPDINTWAAAGPGTIQGLNYLNDRPAQFNLRQSQALPELLELRSALIKEGIELDLSDVTNVCCEVSKYIRTQLGQGRPRQEYKSNQEYY